MSNLIILGGGFAGVWAAMSAATERERLGGDDVVITLVSKEIAPARSTQTTGVTT